MAAAAELHHCPACNARLRAGMANCPSCSMAVAKMNDYIVAMLRARAAGMVPARLERPSGWPKLDVTLSPPVKWALGILAGGVGILLLYMLVVGSIGPGEPAWKKYPTDPQDLLHRYFVLIEKDEDAAHDLAYGLVALPEKHPEDSDEVGRYRQLFHVIHKYLSDEISPGWTKGLSILPAEPAADPAKEPTTYIVKVGLETLHVQIAPQGPEKGGAGGGGGGVVGGPAHYGVVEVQEFPIGQAANFQKLAGITGVVRGIGGNQAASNLQQVLGAGGSPGRETPMQTKLRVLPLIRDLSNVTLKRALLHLWPVRNDPLVRARLTALVADQRYAPEMQRVAQEILEERVDPVELMAIGVDIR